MQVRLYGSGRWAPVRETAGMSARCLRSASCWCVSCRVNGHRFLPIRGHFFSPLVAMFSPHWWPLDLPTVRVGGRSGQGLHPFAGGRLGEPVAVLAFGDQDVGVVKQPVDGRGGDAFGHQLVEPARVDVG